ncbi:adenylate/guanylate cyclase domain-containing protein, partial [Mesorhizobium prunaredense]|uniref:adenylate/guanylate cyclase domain-containing protein n=1 Tax=Mesorhizobium prunaredense TaxID=1631249 RepID=UPI0011810979
MSESRKLAAILAADVVGYSRLAGADEDRILARLRALRSDLIDPTIAVHHGRVVKRTGDGALVEFRSVVDAVRCAIEVQNAMIERNAGVPPDRRIEFRIGIHIGDVVEESDGDLMGDGVNIAARLEAIAAPGAICLSEDAYRQVRSRLDVFVSDLGQTQLKNITEPMRIYSLEVGVRTKAGVVAPVAPPAASPAAPVELAQKPSIAVLPFTNMSGDPEQEYFGDGVTEDIITELSRFRSLFVIARNSSFQFRDKAADMKRVARELGVQYLVEGSIRRSGEKLRVTAQLIEAATGTHIWAERYDRDVRDIFDLQDELAHAVAATVGGRVDMAGRERSARLSHAGLKAYDLHLRAKASYLEFTKAGNEKARILAEEAIELDPTNAVITAYYAHYCFLDYNFGWVLDADQSLTSALEFGKQAVTLDDAESSARWVLSLERDELS